MILGYFHTVSGGGGMDRHRGIFIERIATCTPTKNRHKGDYQVSASHRSGTMYCGVVARAVPGALLGRLWLFQFAPPSRIGNDHFL